MTSSRISFAILFGLIVVLSLVAKFSESLFEKSVVSNFVSTTSTESSEGVAGRKQLTLDDVLGMAHDILDNLNTNVRDYRAEMIKRERVSGFLGTEARIELKVRNRRTVDGQTLGLAAYLRFLSPKSTEGREVIWVEGENEGKLLSHEGGFKKHLGTMKLTPDGRLAMLGNKYPITEIGLVRLAEKLIEKGERDQQLSQARVEIIEDQLVGDHKCRLIQVTHPEPKEGLDFHIAQVFVDVERNVPLRYAAYMWPENPDEPPPLEEEYTFLGLELNVGFTDADFDPENPAYEFP